ncbi:monosaccharide ABC transporter membrane protein, CUT2 family (TC 3.A.1.2.-) [Geosporobacter subterraneus DSM 17957]|uniref:Monosaccharide ABC transporter membrane protein, CUT2 family (TC 3.A.1.2.-) n=1 Tax=Geosporobacter subterraneus DSM 17957 TaxID=1121919 RepID=A0A1M6LV56_9FIRM|nr:ABC transporter [Geosporobacter subterraneus]SHJ75022.1 monosaccharide ABC transporter membrane protein, CUT2 family (TC 3.A.1.2.-) [Geosporobacter subterraneus DSM 17957]
MREKIRLVVQNIGLPRIIIISFLLTLIFGAVVYKIPLDALTTDTLVRFGMNGVLVLAMVPCIQSGTGLNFGLPLGIICGILAGLISIEMNLVGFQAIFTAMLISIPLSAISGYFYGVLLNKVKGSEMMVGNYVGFSVVSLMCIGWLVLPFKNGEIIWPISGKGLRTTIALTSRYDKILNEFMSFKIGGVVVPTGLILFFFMACFLMWLFMRSKTGIALKAVGDNPRFATASGIHVDRARLIGTVLSTVIGGIGIIVYAQSFGFFQLYQAPLYMAFPPVAAILIGGASTRNAKISHVIMGTLLFQALLTIALPVANKLVSEGNLSEVARIIVSNGIILYALTQAGGGE